MIVCDIHAHKSELFDRERIDDQATHMNPESREREKKCIL